MGTFACVSVKHSFFMEAKRVNLFIFCENIYHVDAIFSIACVHSKQSWYRDTVAFLVSRTNSLLVLSGLLHTRKATNWDKIDSFTSLSA